VRKLSRDFRCSCLCALLAAVENLADRTFSKSSCSILILRFWPQLALEPGVNTPSRGQLAEQNRERATTRKPMLLLSAVTSRPKHDVLTEARRLGFDRPSWDAHVSNFSLFDFYLRATYSLCRERISRR